MAATRSSRPDKKPVRAQVVAVRRTVTKKRPTTKKPAAQTIIAKKLAAKKTVVKKAAFAKKARRQEAYRHIVGDDSRCEENALQMTGRSLRTPPPLRRSPRNSAG
jgi:hypothetical protein